MGLTQSLWNSALILFSAFYFIFSQSWPEGKKSWLLLSSSRSYNSHAIYHFKRIFFKLTSCPRGWRLVKPPMLDKTTTFGFHSSPCCDCSFEVLAGRGSSAETSPAILNQGAWTMRAHFLLILEKLLLSSRQSYSNRRVMGTVEILQLIKWHFAWERGSNFSCGLGIQL